MTQATEYMIAEADDQGVFRPLPHCGSFYTDRWYGPDDDATTGSDAAWRALERVVANAPGVYTVVKVRTFERPEGHGLIGAEPTPEVTRAPVGRGRLAHRAHRMINFVRSANPITWLYAAGVAALVALGWAAGDVVWSYGEALVQWISR